MLIAPIIRPSCVLLQGPILEVKVIDFVIVKPQEVENVKN